MTRFIAFFVFLFTVATLNLHAAGGTASFEVWSDNGSLTKLSSNTTDSVLFTRQGSTAVIQCEVRETYNGRPTRRLQITLTNFTGVGNYSVNSGTSYWENFSATKTCDCFGAASNLVKITDYDSVKNNCKGTFEFKCMSTSTAGDKLNYRIRNGSFDAGQPKISLDLLPKDTVKLRKVSQDTTIGIRIKVLDASGAVLDGADIFVNDNFATNSPAFTKAATTSSSGVFVYTTTIGTSTPSGIYNIKIYAQKSGMRSSDTMTVMYKYGKRYYDYICGGLSILSFDAGAGKEWTDETGSPTIKCDGPVTIGEVLKMDGVTRIDTTPGAIKVFMGGRLYIPQVHFEDGSVEDFELSLPSGQDFPLPDCNGIMKLASEKKLVKKLPGGVELSLKEFSIINRPDAKGLRLKAGIKMANTSVGCNEAGATDTAARGLDIGVSVTTSGFENLSIDVSEISLGPAFCIKEFSANADFVNKQYYVGGKISFPVKSNSITLGGGALFKNNLSNPDNQIHLDSLQASLELGTCKPIPETPLCFKGLSFSTSGLSASTWSGAAVRASVVVNSDEQIILSDAKFKWLNDLLGSPAIAEIEGTLEYRHPLIFTGAVTTRIAKLPVISEDKPWQIEGTHSATIDFNSSIAFNGAYKMGHLGGDDYFLNVTGNVTMQWIPVLGVSANVTGAAKIPKPSDEVLTDHPFVGGVLRFMQLSGWIPQDLGNSTALISQNEVDGFLMQADVDVSRNPIDYIRSFGRMSVKLAYKNSLSFSATQSSVPPSRTQHGGIEIQSVKHDSPMLQAVALDTIKVDDSIERLFVVISGANKAPSSTLVDPDGTSFSIADTAKGIYRFATPQNEMVQWTIVNPKVGSWLLKLSSPTAGDSVEITANRKNVPFEIAATQTASKIECTWTSRTASPSDVVRFYLDTDTLGFNGIYVGSAPANSGAFSYTLPSNLTECSYHLYAVRSAKGYATQMNYAPGEIHGNGSIVPPPANVSATANSHGKTVVRWTRLSDPSVVGYSIFVVDKNNRDSLYAVVYASESEATLQLNNADMRNVYVCSFNAQGVRSCRTQGAAIVTEVHEDEQTVNPSFEHPVVAIPNPAVNQVRIRCTEYIGSVLGAEIFDVNGHSRMTTVSTTASDELSIDTHQFESGVYLVKVHTIRGVYWTRLSIIR